MCDLAIKGKFGLSKGCLFIDIPSSCVDKYINQLDDTRDITSLIPVNAKNNRRKRDGDNYHITVINHLEMKNIDNVDIINSCEMSSELNINIFGLGINSGCYYLVCGCKKADEVRKNYHLKYLHYHVTLGFDFDDKHDINKGISTIVSEDKNIISNVINSLSVNSKKNLEMLKNLYERH